MRINNLKEKLKREIKETLIHKELNTKKTKIKEPIIIGITGSRGKSSVAYMLHKFIKCLGYKSILYSSIEIDSDLSYAKKHFAVDNPIKDKKVLLSAVEQSIAQNADFLILEINERAINLGIIDDVEFDIRVLTNIIEKQNEVFYENYVELKKSFLINSREDEKLVYIVKDNFCRQLIDELKNKNQTIISTPYLIERFNIDKNKVNYLISSNEQIGSIDGIKFNLKIDNENYEIRSNMLFTYSCFNITCVIAVLRLLNLYDHNKFLEFIKVFRIPGRDEKITFNNRNIIISLNLVPQLEELYKYKTMGQINNIIVVTGATGTGFKGWKNEFSTDLINKDKELAMKFAYNYLNKFADTVIVTKTDLGTTSIDNLFELQKSLLSNSKKQFFVKNRKKAIEIAILNSNENDAIFISGRGNREILCVSYDKISFSKDIDLLEQVLKEVK